MKLPQASKKNTEKKGLSLQRRKEKKVSIHVEEAKGRREKDQREGEDSKKKENPSSTLCVMRRQIRLGKANWESV